ncbi:MAG: hypothetical protein KDE25_11235 [Novosphingobium sp.]|nr:hypothetical protein [Novosphingobium sp.]
MHRAFACLASLFALIGQSATLQAHVIGKDDRSYLSHAEEERFAGVGKVHCDDPTDPDLDYWTTGTLVGDQKTVFTNGHFGVKPASRRSEPHIFPVEHCEFRIYAPHGGKFADGYAYKRFAIASAQRAQPPEAYIDYKADREDWAVLTLSGAGVDAASARALTVRQASMDELVEEPDSFLIAYHDKVKGIDPDARVISPGCAVRKDRRASDDTWFLLDCDTNKGSSGGLIFAKDATGEHVALGFATSDGLAKENDHSNYGQPFTADVRGRIPGANIPFVPTPKD